MCVCVCVRERERQGDTEREIEKVYGAIVWNYLVVQKYGSRGTDNDEGAPGEQSKQGSADTGQDQGLRYTYTEFSIFILLLFKEGM